MATELPTLMPSESYEPEPDPEIAFEAGGGGPEVRPLIDGVPISGAGPRLVLVDPATGAPSGTLLCAGPEDIERAAMSASFSSALWRGISFNDRAQRLRRLAVLIQEQCHDIAELIAREQGKPYPEALTLEVLPALDHLKFVIRHAADYHAGMSIDQHHPLYAHKRSLYLYDPVGVVALVTPTPLPFAVPLIQTAAALAMGNAVVIKPSERTPRCGLRVGELCLEAGIPAGLVNVVPAIPEDTLRLVAHPKVDKVFVTAGIDAGQDVMATAGCTPRPVVLSLGGKHPAVVAGDADVDRAARGIAWGALANCGQNCGAVERVYVEESIVSRFLERLLAEVDRLKLGEPLEPGVDIGPLVSEERRQIVHNQVGDAVRGGARLLRGGVIPPGPGFFYPPTVILGPPGGCRLMREETLGPVIPIIAVESIERAILLANDADYALTASGWTTSAEVGNRLMVGLNAGVVTINDVLYSFGEPASTWSGFRKSGIGQNHGTAGLREMCRQRFVSFDGSKAEASVFGFPYDDRARVVSRAALEYLHGHRRHRRFAALLRLMFSKRFRARLPLRSFLLARGQKS